MAPSATLAIDAEELPPGQYLLIIEPTGERVQDLYDESALSIWAINKQNRGHRVGALLTGNIASAALSPDGTLLAVVSLFPYPLINPPSQISLFSLEGEDVLPQWGEVEGITGLSAWRPDNSGIAIEHEWDIKYLPIGSTIAIPLTHCEAILDDADCSHPSWSPDATSLIFTLYRAASGSPPPESGTYILPSSCARGPTECTESAVGPLPHIKEYAVWAPNGVLIAGVTASKDGLVVLTYPSLDVLRAGRSGTSSPYNLVFAPDSRSIAYDAECAVHILSIASFEVTPSIQLDPCYWDPRVVGWLEVE